MNTPRVSVCLLAAGYGTRLYPLTKDHPKALLPLGSGVTPPPASGPKGRLSSKGPPSADEVGGGVILDWILDTVEAVPGLSKLVLVTNHKFFPQFEAWQRTHSRALELVDDGTSTPETRLGAIRDLMLGLAQVGACDDLLVLGTDNVFTWSLADFVAFAKRKRPSATVALRQATSLQAASRCAVVELDGAARLIRCVEKPASPFSSTVALCVYYFSQACRGRFEEFVRIGGNVDAPGYFIEWLVKQEPVYGFMTDGEWFDIGSKESYQEAVQRWSRLAPLARLQRTNPTGGSR